MQNSSQPFLYSYNNHKYLLYCYSDKIQTLQYYGTYSARPWKIYLKHLETNIIAQVPTVRYHASYGSSVIECNPHIHSHNPSTLYWNAGFCEGGNKPIVYYLVSMEAKDPTFAEFYTDSFTIIAQCFTGTLIDNQLLIRQTGFKNAKLQLSDNSLLDFAHLGFKHILKINRQYNSDQYILTGEDSNKNTMSVLLNEDFSFNKYLLNNENENVYKCSILDNIFAYTVKEQSDQAEARRLVFEEVANV